MESKTKNQRFLARDEATRGIYAARILSGLCKSTRSIVQFEMEVYMAFFHPQLERKRVIIDQETKDVLYVAVDREQAIKHLQQKYQLYDKLRILRDFERLKKNRHLPN
jgi:hypothetical protein